MWYSANTYKVIVHVYNEFSSQKVFILDKDETLDDTTGVLWNRKTKDTQYNEQKEKAPPPPPKKNKNKNKTRIHWSLKNRIKTNQLDLKLEWT